jgi:hypothetical protein
LLRGRWACLRSWDRPCELGRRPKSPAAVPGPPSVRTIQSQSGPRPRLDSQLWLCLWPRPSEVMHAGGAGQVGLPGDWCWRMKGLGRQARLPQTRPAQRSHSAVALSLSTGERSSLVRPTRPELGGSGAQAWAGRKVGPEADASGGALAGVDREWASGWRVNERLVGTTTWIVSELARPVLARSVLALS